MNIWCELKIQYVSKGPSKVTGLETEPATKVVMILLVLFVDKKRAALEKW